MRAAALNNAVDTDGKAIISAELVERLERVQKMCAARVNIAKHL